MLKTKYALLIVVVLLLGAFLTSQNAKAQSPYPFQVLYGDYMEVDMKYCENNRGEMFFSYFPEEDRSVRLSTAVNINNKCIFAAVITQGNFVQSFPFWGEKDVRLTNSIPSWDWVQTFGINIKSLFKAFNELMALLPTPTPTKTVTPTSTATSTMTLTPTNTATPTNTLVPTATAIIAPSPTPTPTQFPLLLSIVRHTPSVYGIALLAGLFLILIVGIIKVIGQAKRKSSTLGE